MMNMDEIKRVGILKGYMGQHGGFRTELLDYTVQQEMIVTPHEDDEEYTVPAGKVTAGELAGKRVKLMFADACRNKEEETFYDTAIKRITKFRGDCLDPKTQHTTFVVLNENGDVVDKNDTVTIIIHVLPVSVAGRDGFPKDLIFEGVMVECPRFHVTLTSNCIDSRRRLGFLGYKYVPNGKDIEKEEFTPPPQKEKTYTPEDRLAIMEVLLCSDITLHHVPVPLAWEFEGTMPLLADALKNVKEARKNQLVFFTDDSVVADWLPTLGFTSPVEDGADQAKWFWSNDCVQEYYHKESNVVIVHLQRWVDRQKAVQSTFICSKHMSIVGAELVYAYCTNQSRRDLWFDLLKKESTFFQEKQMMTPVFMKHR